MSTPAVFLDKDGTLIEDVPYNVDPALIVLRPGAGAALRRLQAAGFRLIVVSNQSGVARGLFAEEALGEVEARLRALLAAESVALDGFLYCPHHPEGAVPAYARVCACRKPAPGMLLRAARDLDLDLGRSWLFGDILDDIEAGHRAGCRAVLVDSGGETLWQVTPARTPDAIAPDLITAARVALTPRPPLPSSTGRGGASANGSVRWTGQLPSWPPPYAGGEAMSGREQPKKRLFDHGRAAHSRSLPQDRKGLALPPTRGARSPRLQPTLARHRSSPRVGGRPGEGYQVPPSQQRALLQPTPAMEAPLPL